MRFLQNESLVSLRLPPENRYLLDIFHTSGVRKNAENLRLLATEIFLIFASKQVFFSP
jgi:hypothetical protein